MSRNYENGIIAISDSGDEDISQDILTTGTVFWVNSIGGNDANAGTNRVFPKASIASAISAATASNGDIIICESGHIENISSVITISKAGIRIFGLGAGSAKPKFIVTAAIDLFDLTGSRIELNNLQFPAGTTIANTSRINPNSAKCKITNCDFECGAFDLDSITVPDAGDDVEITGCTFTITADGPDSGIRIESASTLGVTTIGNSFDGGDFDFDDAAIFSAVAHLNYVYRKNTLINKASIIHTAAAKGQATGTVMGDGSRVEV